MTRARPGPFAIRFGLAMLALVVAGLTFARFGRLSEQDHAPRQARDPAVPAVAAGRKPAAVTPSTATPARYTGPQGRVGQFVVRCSYSHSGAHDPIVHPGREGRSHRHDFYGSDETDSLSSVDDLLGSETTCDKSVDTAGYWQPTLFDHDKIVVPAEVEAYYRAAPGIDPKSVKTMPTGLALIAGDQTATEPQAGEATGWTCGSQTTLSDDPPTCPASAPLHLVLTFPDCWDGRFIDSEDHRSHVDYSTEGTCPAAHKVSIPQLTMSIKFPIFGGGHDLRLASGNIYSAHGDFWNAWDPSGLEREIRSCIRRGAVCDLASNREEEPLFSDGR